MSNEEYEAFVSGLKRKIRLFRLIACGIALVFLIAGIWMSNLYRDSMEPAVKLPEITPQNIEMVSQMLNSYRVPKPDPVYETLMVIFWIIFYVAAIAAIIALFSDYHTVKKGNDYVTVCRSGSISIYVNGERREHFFFRTVFAEPLKISLPGKRATVSISFDRYHINFFFSGAKEPVALGFFDERFVELN